MQESLTAMPRLADEVESCNGPASSMHKVSQGLQPGSVNFEAVWVTVSAMHVVSAVLCLISLI